MKKRTQIIFSEQEIKKMLYSGYDFEDTDPEEMCAHCVDCYLASNDISDFGADDMYVEIKDINAGLKPLKIVPIFEYFETHFEEIKNIIKKIKEFKTFMEQ